MSLNPYYEDEIGYLRELGEEFSKVNPLIASFLGRETQDPDVERLLEGFAFLTSRLRQQLDNEIPEVIHGLIRLVWPYYLCPIPPMTILQFTPVAGAGEVTMKLPKGVEVLSSPVEGQRCRFRTAYDGNVFPLSISNIELDNRVNSAKLSLTCDVHGRAKLSALSSTPLRLFLNAEREPLVGRLLLNWLLRHVKSIHASLASGQEITLGADSIKPVGFSRNEAVLPYPENGFSGFRIIQEYMSFPEKFLFVDLDGLAPLFEGTTNGPLTIRIEFTRPFPEQMRASEKMIQLNCIPAVNLFSSDAIPVRIEKTKTDYRIRPIDAGHINICSIDQVTGFSQGKGSTNIFSFESMKHDIVDNDGRGTTFYRERIRPGTNSNNIEHYISLVDRKDKTLSQGFDSLSVRITCSNGGIAHRLSAGGVDQPTSSVPSGLTVKNVTAVTREALPPIGDNMLWRLVSNLSRNFSSINDVDSLRSLLHSYDFRAVYDPQAKRRLELFLQSIDSMASTVGNTLLRGVPIRYRDVTLKVIESKLTSEGELFLFGSVVDSLLTAYSGVNSLHKFSVEGIETGVKYSWPMRTGEEAI